MKAWKLILILAIVIIGIISIIFLLQAFGIEFPTLAAIGARPNDLVIDTNKGCVSDPTASGFTPTCIWEGHIDAPNNAENVTFLISYGLKGSSGGSASIKVEVWSGVWKTLFSQRITTPGAETVYYSMSEQPGTPGTRIYVNWHDPKYSEYACETGYSISSTECTKLNEGIPFPPSAQCICKYHPYCYVKTKDSSRSWTYCIMPKEFLNKNYIINNQIKFRTTYTYNSGGGGYYFGLNPQGYNGISIYDVEFGTEEIPEPPVVDKPLIFQWIDKVIDWFKNLFG